MSRADDLPALWAYATTGLPARLIAEILGLRSLRRFARVLGALPIAPEGDGSWCMVDLRLARPADWQIILAARAGLPCHPLAVPGAEPHPDLPGFLSAKGWRTARAYEALRGRELVDLVAWVPGWRGEPLRRLLGHAVALGDARGLAVEEQPPEAGTEPQPLPVVRDLRAWLRQAARGAVLPLGEPVERQAYLRGLEVGILAEDALHAAELARFLKRDLAPPPPLPRVWLAGPDDAAAAA